MSVRRSSPAHSLNEYCDGKPELFYFDTDDEERERRACVVEGKKIAARNPKYYYCSKEFVVSAAFAGARADDMVRELRLRQRPRVHELNAEDFQSSRAAKPRGGGGGGKPRVTREKFEKTKRTAPRGNRKELTVLLKIPSRVASARSPAPSAASELSSDEDEDVFSSRKFTFENNKPDAADEEDVADNKEEEEEERVEDDEQKHQSDSMDDGASKTPKEEEKDATPETPVEDEEEDDDGNAFDTTAEFACVVCGKGKFGPESTDIQFPEDAQLLSCGHVACRACCPELFRERGGLCSTCGKRVNRCVRSITVLEAAERIAELSELAC